MTGSGTLLDPFVIRDVNDLQAMENDLYAYYELGQDIDASATSGWNGGLGFDPIISFYGQLDGKGFNISNLFINRPSEVNTGFIGNLDGVTYGLGIVKNINLKDTNITGQSNVGGLAGYNYEGTIQKCSVTGSVTSQSGNVGGLVGYNSGGTIEKSYSLATVSGKTTIYSGYGGIAGVNDKGSTISQCYATGDITGYECVGGLVGGNWGAEIIDCYARGDVSGTAGVGGLVGDNYSYTDAAAEIIRSYSTGTVTGTTDVGGLVGENYDGTANEGTVTDSFWDAQTSGQATSDGGTGKTTAQMKTRTTFTDAGWSFPAIWKIRTYRNDGYPYLAWQYTDYLGNPNIDQLIFQRAERMTR